MSCRRSTRIASKTSSVPEFEYEENDAQHFDLKTRTPKTSRQYTSQNQKRKQVQTPNRDVAFVDCPKETGRNLEVNSYDSPAVNYATTPEVLTQNQFRHRRHEVVIENGGFDSRNESSFGNADLLLAIEELEEKHSKGVNVNLLERNVGPGIKGDNALDEDDEDVLPTTPPNELVKSAATPTTSRKRLLSSKSLELGNSKPSASTNQDLRAGSDLEPVQEPQRKRSKRRSNGEKKTSKKTGQAKKKKKGKFKLAFTNRKAIKELANSASNELSKEDLSMLPYEEKLLLSSWNLPFSILNNYQKKGITSLFHWQLDCLANEKVLEGKNLLYSAPTSAGKTLVSEILMIKRVLELGRKAIMILPFVSVAREKVYSLQSIFGDAGIRVEGFMGSVNPPGGFKAVDIAVCTIEKANSLVNKLLEEDSLADLGTLVVDELHLIGDPHRGYLLELLLTKILYMTSVKNAGSDNSMNMSNNASWKPRKYHIQIIGMSATLPNLDTLAKWLNAELYITDFRPVPLKERFKLEDKMLDENLEPVRDVKVDEIPMQIEGDTEDIIYLTLETVLNGFSVLLFCPTKALVEKTAERIALQVYNIGAPSNEKYPQIRSKIRELLDVGRIKSVVDQLKQCPGGVDETLSKAVSFGIGYHHAGLTYENRDIVESAFKKGILKVIVATSTLSAGVNLPARRVIITTPLFNRSVLDTMTYRQMCGRAGRNGIDTEGESILICPSDLKEKGMALYRGSMPIVRSALLGDESLTSAMKRALLEAIASGIASLTSDVTSYAHCTFLFHSLNSGLFESEELSLSQVNKEATVENCLKYLMSQDFVRIKHFEDEDRPDEYMPTQLGSACLASSLSPDDAIIVYKELLKARECFVLENELHVIYQVTPIYVSDQLRYIEWKDYLYIYEHLDLSEKKVAELVGINEGFIFRAMIGTVSWSNPAQRSSMAIHQRFYAALALSELVNEQPITAVSAKYGLNKGVLQNLQQAASTFAGMITAFCGRLGWSNLELLLSQFQERLEFGVQRELCDLVRLDCLNGQRARILYDAGLKTVMELAAADPGHVEHILHKATPFKSDVHGGRDSHIWMIGKDVLTEAEAAQKIVTQARQFIQIELGQQGNIQFAFSTNDAAASSGKSRNNTLNTSHKTQSKLHISAKLDDEDEQEGESDDKDEEEKDEEKVESADEIEIAPKDDVESKEKEEKLANDFLMEELFSQRPLELEASVQLPKNESKLQDSQDMFEDSFPEIVSTNLSALYPKDEEKPETPKPQSTFSIQHHVDRLVRQQHSTPLNLNGKIQRFSLKTEEQTSPVRPPVIEQGHQHHNLHETKEKIRDHSEKLFEDDELSDGILAELDHDFDSFRDSMNESKKAAASKLGASRLSAKLSESDVEAMKALAEDSNFESEELFPDAETNRGEVVAQEDVDDEEQQRASNRSSPSRSMKALVIDNMLDGLNEEDFILTQPVDIPEKNSEEQSETFEESSEETESSESNWTSTGDSTNTPSEDSAPEEKQAVVGGKRLFVKVAKSVDQIPSEFFLKDGMLGMGLKIVAQKKSSSTSLARHGIGARIVGKALNKAALKGDECQVEYNSISLFNGADVIWMYRWTSESTIGVASRKKKLDVLLDRIRSRNCAVALFKCKDKLKALVKSCGARIMKKVPPGEKLWDPRVAQWLWEYDEEEFNATEEKLVSEYVSPGDQIISSTGWEKEVIEAFHSWKVMNALKPKLESKGLWDHFINIEMPSIIPLMLMEWNGFGLDTAQMTKLRHILQFKSAVLELRAFLLAGRQFNLGSPKEIKQVLFREIGLKQPKAKGTGKDVLLKLDHELPGIIVEWRKVNHALNNFVISFQQERNLGTGRIHGHYSHFTVTGRLTMHDPNLQCIPRDFDLSQFTFTPKDIKELKLSCKIKFGSKLTSLFQIIDNTDLFSIDSSIINNVSQISMRNAFVPCNREFAILTADYSQLELRILAHLSGDEILLKALNGDTDVFVEIASKWKKIPKEKVTNSIRQEAKNIVYGVIYGMGSRALADQMEIDEREASRFMDQFYRIYVGVSSFINEAKRKCKERGYIETMSGRRRYLPLINSLKPHERAKAERQAVNSQIQGSAADLVKSAMARIHSSLSSKFPESALPIEWSKVERSRQSSPAKPILSQVVHNSECLEDMVFIPILNLHDELIFEVRRSHLDEVARVVRNEMESCLKLRVKLPVVVKVGDSWGNLDVYEFKD